MKMSTIEEQKKFILEIEEEKRKRKNTIQEDKSVFKSYINSHNELKKTYNGRQVFEMLQNIDDQKSKNCCIELNSKEKTLIFYNTGIPFSVDGIKSIMLQNISPKNKVNYIGNKGLGFRSILNWSQEIEIYSDGKIIEFSKEISKKYSKIENVSELMFPKISLIEQNKEWDTYVKLKNINIDIISEIKKELEQFNASLLLFLRNLNSILIKINKTELYYDATPVKKLNGKIMERTISYKTQNNEDKKDLWWILSCDNGDGNNFCNVQIAITPNNLENKNNKLYNYFPTNHTIKLPCILHATLELTDSRKQIQDNSELNEQILTQFIPNAFNELAEFIRDYKKEDCWCAYKLLSAPEDSDDDLIKLLYDKILEIRDNGKFHPCIDGSFKSIDNIIYYNEEINSYFDSEYWRQKLPDILKPNAPKYFKTKYYYTRSYLQKVTKDIIEHYNYDNKELIKLIHMLYKMNDLVGDSNKENTKPYELLRNNNNNFIRGAALTPQDNENIKLPSYLKYTYISKEFYELFCDEFSEEINKHGDESVKRRSFINKIKKDKFLNITFYDRYSIRNEIISKCKELIRKDNKTIEYKNNIISKMLSALYKNVNIADKFDETNIPIYVNFKNKVVYATDLLFSTAKKIYGKKLAESAYLKDFSIWSFTKNETEEDLKNFFKKLGVQEKIRLTNKNITYKEHEYFSYIILKGFIIDGRFDNSSNHTIKALVDADIIKNLPIDIFLSLLPTNVGQDKTFKDLLLESYLLPWIPNRAWNPRYCECNYSYPAYQLSEMMNKYILNINNKTFKDLGFLSLDKNNNEEFLMRHLGARALEDFSRKELYEILDKVYQKNIKPNKVFYKYIFDAIKNHQDDYYNVDSFKSRMLYAQVGENDYEYRQNNEIYYDDNKSFGKIYLNKNFPILYLQPKLGIDKVHEVFGIKKIGITTIKEYEINEKLNEVFNKDLKKYLPYFLAIKINNKNLSDNDKFANALKNLKINIVKNLNYEVEGTSFVLDYNCFTYADKQYYIRFNGALEDIHKDLDFCSTLADILTIELEAISEEQNYKACYNNIGLYDHLFKQNPDLKDEVNNLLCNSDDEIALWDNIISKADKNKEYAKIQDKSQLIEKFKEDSGISFNINDGARTNYKKIEDLANHYNCEPEELLKGTNKFIDMTDIHKKEFKDMFDKLKNSFCYLTWGYLNKNIELQKYYRKLINSYSNIIDSDDIDKICKMYSEKAKSAIDYKQEILKLLNNGKWHNLNEEFKLQIDWTKLTLNDDWRDSIKYLEYNSGVFEENDEIYSLLFFDNNKDKLKNIKEEYDKKKEIIRKVDEDDNYDKLIPKKFELSKDFDFESKIKKQKSGTGKAGLKENNNKKVGRKAEFQVLSYLKEQKKENIKHVSGYSKSSDRDDSCHYDIQYQENGRIKYVEVKSSETSEFYLTEQELEFAQQNKDDYILAIVRKGCVDLKTDFIENLGTFYKIKPDVHKVKFLVKEEEIL